MASIKQFKLPDLGEGLTEGEILKWLVGVGDQVRLNQPIVEVETAKAAVEVPSPYAGLVTELFYAEGDTADVGSPIISFDTEPAGAGGEAAAMIQAEGAAANPAESIAAVDRETVIESPPAEGAVEPGLIGGPAPGGRTSVLVGYGPKSVTAKRRQRKPPATIADVAAEAVSTSDLVEPVARVSAAEVGAAALRRVAEPVVLAKPPVRKLARDLGVDLRDIAASGPGGSVTRADVQAAAAQGSAVAGGSPAAPAAVGEPASIADRGAREVRTPIKGVRKLTAAAMSASAFTAPHVTEFVTVDVTRGLRLLDRLKGTPEYAGVRVSPLLLVVKALLLAVRRHPLVNSTWDEPAQEIVSKNYVNLGIAAATPRGLIVPNIKDADAMTLRELAEAMADLVATARAGRTTPADMAGGTITITNVGVFGIDTGTPILNPGESAILAFGAVRPQPWVHKGKVKPRQVTTLALSFDHRVIDGELGSMFLADLATVLNDPEAALLAWG